MGLSPDHQTGRHQLKTETTPTATSKKEGEPVAIFVPEIPIIDEERLQLIGEVSGAYPKVKNRVGSRGLEHTDLRVEGKPITVSFHRASGLNSSKLDHLHYSNEDGTHLEFYDHTEQLEMSTTLHIGDDVVEVTIMISSLQDPRKFITPGIEFLGRTYRLSADIVINPVRTLQTISDHDIDAVMAVGEGVVEIQDIRFQLKELTIITEEIIRIMQDYLRKLPQLQRNLELLRSIHQNQLVN